MTMTQTTPCESCGGTYNIEKGRVVHRATTSQPSIETLQAWDWEDGGCESTDGCWVEPDGICEHGHVSWLRRLGFI